MFKYLKTFIWVCITSFLLFLNIATLVNSKVYDFSHHLLSKIPYERLMAHSKSAELKKLRNRNIKLSKKLKMRALKSKKYKGVSKRIARRVFKRSIRNGERTFSSVFEEAIPIAGIVVTAGIATWDIYDDCQDIKDMNELLASTGQYESQSASKVCGIKIPSVDDLTDYARKSLYEWKN